AARLVEVPPGNAVDRRYQDRPFAQEVLDGGRGRGQGVRLDGDDYEVLRPQLAGVVGVARVSDQRLPFASEREAVGPHRREVGPPGDAAHLRRPGGGELGRQVSADGPGAEDGDLHGSSPSFAASPMRCSLPVGPRGSSVTKTILCGTL